MHIVNGCLIFSLNWKNVWAIKEYFFFPGKILWKSQRNHLQCMLANQKEEIKEIPYIHMEEIDWKKKGMAFLKAKIWK